MTGSISEARLAGIKALARMQAADGSFPLRTVSAATPWVPCGPLFSTAYAVMAAGRLLPPDTVGRAIAFVRTQRRPDGLWEYDPAIHIPPDADSTACALAALALHGDTADLQGGPVLLRAFWRGDAGPFRSWAADGMWSLPERDDAVVNCNILFALRLLGAPATPLEEAGVIQLIQRTAGRSRYYVAQTEIAYGAARGGLDRAALPAPATARPETRDLLGCAQWLSSAPGEDGSMMAAVLGAQRSDGSWPIRPWVTGAGRPKPFWGSAAVTTALAIEALDRCSKKLGEA